MAPVAYSEKAWELRRCKAIRKDGNPCESASTWGDIHCHAHGGKSTKKHVCNCIAYDWPHRPGGGVCQWPETPEYMCTTGKGTHKFTARLRFKGAIVAYEMRSPAEYRRRKRELNK